MNDVLSDVGGKLPEHIAIIMDGNGRWAKQRGLVRTEGHLKGIEAVKRTVKAAGEIGIKYLTLYTFSKENWSRPVEEVKALMGMMVNAIVSESEELLSMGVKVKMLGCRNDLPGKVLEKLEELETKSSHNKGLELLLAISYGARWEIVQAVRNIAQMYRDGVLESLGSIDGTLFSSQLTTDGIPDPDLIIRTGGEFRISNFLLWQCAYSEFYFMEKYWPDFGKDDLMSAIENFLARSRRFGKTDEQMGR